MAAYRRPADPAERARRDAAREDKLEALHRRLGEQVDALLVGTGWKAWLEVAVRFHAYSWRNTLLILAQRPDARLVAGYNAWQQLGRQVDKGQRGIQILAPVTRRDRSEGDDAEPAALDTTDADTHDTQDPAAPAATERAGRSVVGWRVAYVWDVSQTSGDPLPEPPSPRLLAGQAPPGLFDSLAAQVEAAGFTLARGDCRGANGITHFGKRTVTVRGDVDDAQAVKTLAHELGHVLLHDPGAGSRATTAGCRGVDEVEAESVAYLICAAAGADTDGYTFPYVASWATQADPANPAAVVAGTGQRVLHTARRVLDQFLTPAGPDPDQQLEELARRTTAGLAATGELRGRAEAATATAAEATAGAGNPRLLAAHAEAAVFYRRQLLDPAAEGPRCYLDTRGLGHVLQPDNRWGVGYAPARWTALTTHLRGLGYTDTELLDAGLGLRSRKGSVVDRFRDRIMLPIRRGDGATVAFIGRAPDTADQDVPKYLNSPATALYRKGEHLLGADQPRLGDGRVVLVEGPLDAVAVTAALPGVCAVAPCGTALTAAHAQQLATRGVRDLVVVFDGDPAGQAAAARVYDTLRVRIQDPQAVRLPAGTDPAGLAETQPARLAELLTDPQHAVPLADLAVDDRLTRWHGRTHTAEGTAAAVRDAAGYIADLPADQVARQVARTAAALDVPHDAVTAALTDAITRGDSASGRLTARASQLAEPGPPLTSRPAPNRDRAAAVSSTTPAPHLVGARRAR